MKPWPNWTLWQTTDKGDGLAYGCESKQVDMDQFNGTVEDLYKYVQVAPPVVVPPPVVPVPSYSAELRTIGQRLIDIAGKL